MIQMVTLSVVFYCFFFAAPLSASEVHEVPDVHGPKLWSWQECIDQTKENNAELKAAGSALKSRQMALRGSYASYFPQLGLSLNYHREGSEGVVGSTHSSYSSTLSVNQSLFSGGRNQAQVDQAAALLQNQKAQEKMVKARVSFELKSAFAQFLYAEKSIQLQMRITQRREDNYRLVHLRFQNGNENKGSELLAQAYLDQAHYEFLQAQNNRQEAQTILSRILGIDELIEINANEKLILEELNSKPDFVFLVKQTPEYEQFKAQQEASTASLTLARSGFFPTLSLSASTGQIGDRWFPQTQQWTVGVGVSLPLFNGGKDYYAWQGAAQDWVETSAQKENGERALLTQLKQSYDGYWEATEKYKVDQRFREAALKRAEIGRSKYNNGLMNFENWDIIENDLIVREKSVLASEKDRIVAEASWQRSQGKGIIP